MVEAFLESCRVCLSPMLLWSMWMHYLLSRTRMFHKISIVFNIIKYTWSGSLHGSADLHQCGQCELWKSNSMWICLKLCPLCKFHAVAACELQNLKTPISALKYVWTRNRSALNSFAPLRRCKIVLSKRCVYTSQMQHRWKVKLQKCLEKIEFLVDFGKAPKLHHPE